MRVIGRFQRLVECRRSKVESWGPGTFDVRPSTLNLLPVSSLRVLYPHVGNFRTQTIGPPHREPRPPPHLLVNAPDVLADDPEPRHRDAEQREEDREQREDALDFGADD